MTNFTRNLDELKELIDPIDNGFVILDGIAELIRELNDKWWRDLYTGEPIERNIGELLCLVHSEISEAMEGDRRSLEDDKLPGFAMLDVQLVDAMIRILAILGHRNAPTGEIMIKKLKYNLSRADHQDSNRLKEDGKKY